MRAVAAAVARSAAAAQAASLHGVPCAGARAFRTVGAWSCSPEAGMLARSARGAVLAENHSARPSGQWLWRRFSRKKTGRGAEAESSGAGEGSGASAGDGAGRSSAPAGKDREAAAMRNLHVIEAEARPLVPDVVMMSPTPHSKLYRDILRQVESKKKGEQGPLIAVFTRKAAKDRPATGAAAAAGEGGSQGPGREEASGEGERGAGGPGGSDTHRLLRHLGGRGGSDPDDSPDIVLTMKDEHEGGEEKEGSGEEEALPVHVVDHAADDLYEVGTLAEVVNVFPVSVAQSQVVLKGLQRVRRTRVASYSGGVLRVDCEPLPDVPLDEADEQATSEAKAREVLVQEMVDRLKATAQSHDLTMYLEVFNTQKWFQMAGNAEGLSYYGAWLCRIRGNLGRLQEILEERSVSRRLEKTAELLRSELAVLELNLSMRRELEDRMRKDHQRHLMMEQLKLLRRELGMEKDDRQELVDKFTKKLQSFKDDVPESTAKVIEDEISRLQTLEASSPEFNLVRNYLEWLTAIPWNVTTPETYDVDDGQRVLDEDHWGLQDVKDRILEFIAVSSLRGRATGKILCLVGPPGVGKTSIARSVARALGRKYYRVSVGGLNDVSEIRGHRRTYVGAMPGKFIQALKASGSRNPLVLIDEVDKVGTHWRGDPTSALLEVLDPEQNRSFTDLYLDVPVDLGGVLFMCTANVLDTIPAPLLDRMEVVRLSGYLAEEKLAIARQYLIPRAYEESGINPGRVEVTDGAMRRLAEEYCREAGVRNLKAHIEKVLRKAALKIVRAVKPAGDGASLPTATSDLTAPAPLEGEAGEGKQGGKSEEEKLPPWEGAPEVTIDAGDLVPYVGQPPFSSDKIYSDTQPAGVVTGLAWTAMGGSTLYIEAGRVERGEGRGGIQTTGQLGSVMQESATIAHTLARGILGSAQPDNDFFATTRVHLHVPAGATPKDGPSAGITMVTALLSLALDAPVKKGLAMTGEVSLTGKVLAVGGIREKCVAARRSGCTHLLLPDANRGDWDELPDSLKEGLEATFVKDYQEVLAAALGPVLEAKPPAAKEASGAEPAAAA
ncbi:unnamed protein product [Pedinophyceae sp. YPF-701]|nr:unnamed protein product [Pedinophyceae sp. YPF-701]